MGIVKALYGKIYWIEAGAGEQLDTLEWFGSIGSELSLRSYLAEEFPIDLMLGYAHPLQEGFPDEWYFTISAHFR